MVNIEYAALSEMSTETLLQELAWRTENLSKYNLLEGVYNSFKDCDGVEWTVKLNNRGRE